MVRKALSHRCAAQVVAIAVIAALARISAQPDGTAAVAEAQPDGAAAVAEALLSGVRMAPPDRTAALPADVQQRLQEYRAREAAFKSGLGTPRDATAEEQAIHDRRVGIERVIFSLFPRRDSAKVAATYAFDADLDREAAFIDRLLADLPMPWLAPYLNLVAGHRKLCDGETEVARRQLAVAWEGGHPLIRVAADHLIATGRCVDR